MAIITKKRVAPITRGILSKRTGCHIETIRYYEQIGLLPDPPRSAGGHRHYSEEHLKRLTFICRARQLGFSLKEVRGLLDLVDGGGNSCEEVKSLTLEHMRDIFRKIADLEKIADVLQSMAAKCDEGEMPECPVIDALFLETS